jgi:hypothetical protein
MTPQKGDGTWGGQFSFNVPPSGKAEKPGRVSETTEENEEKVQTE